MLALELITGLCMTFWVWSVASTPLEWTCLGVCVFADVGMAALLIARRR